MADGNMDIWGFRGSKKLCGDCEWLKNYDDEDCNIELFLKACLKVDSSYIYSPSQDGTRLERVFAYELYHQWSKQIERHNKMADDSHQYMINGEIGKNLNVFINLGGKKEKYPDLVLHKSIDNSDNQGVICEIKRGDDFDKNGLKRDLDKLMVFVCGPHNQFKFRYGVFVAFGVTIDKILEVLDDLGWGLRKRKKTMGADKILLLAYDGLSIQTLTLFDALVTKERKKYLLQQ